MEEILASIRRIIADDEAKPAAADTKVEPSKVELPKTESSKTAAMKPEAVKTEPPKPQVVAAKTPTAAAAPMRPTPVAAKPAPAPAAGNSQDDIDAMLAGFDSPTPEPDAQSSSPDLDVFELTDDMALPDSAPNPFRKVDPQDDLEFSESARSRQPSFDAPHAADPMAALGPNILSRSTVSAVESAFNSLANTVLSNNARTLEDLVKEMLRPMLKTWLDDNLPGLVERIVKAEIERVSRGR